MEHIDLSSSFSSLFLEDLSKDLSFSELLAHLQKVSGLVTAICDVNYHVLCASPGEPKDIFWQTLLREEQIPDKLLQKDLSASAATHLFSSDSSLTFPALDGVEGPFCLHPLFQRQTPAGLILIMYQDAAQTDLVIRTARELAQVAGYYLRQKENVPVSTTDFMQVYLAREFLLYDTSLREDILPPGYLIGAFAPAEQEQDLGLRAFAQELHILMPNVLLLIHEKKLLVFFYDLSFAPGDRLKLTDSAFFSAIDRLCRSSRITGGLSAYFERPEERRYFKQLALDTLSCAQRRSTGPSLCSADQLYTPLFLERARKRIGANVLELSEIKLLRTTDQKNHTNYLDTLHRYLLAENRISVAAEHLFLDRNTLRYRLQKIRSLLHTDFDQPQNAMLLLLSIELSQKEDGDQIF